MMKCELCGGKADYVDHYEEHIDPPRRMNICRSCHSSIEGHNVLKRGKREKRVSMRKKEYRIFLGEAEAKWLDKLVEEGDLGRTHSEVIRTILRDVRRGLIK